MQDQLVRNLGGRAREQYNWRTRSKRKEPSNQGRETPQNERTGEPNRARTRELGGAAIKELPPTFKGQGTFLCLVKCNMQLRALIWLIKISIIVGIEVVVET